MIDDASIDISVQNGTINIKRLIDEITQLITEKLMMEAEKLHLDELFAS